MDNSELSLSFSPARSSERRLPSSADRNSRTSRSTPTFPTVSDSNQPDHPPPPYVPTSPDHSSLSKVKPETLFEIIDRDLYTEDEPMRRPGSVSFNTPLRSSSTTTSSPSRCTNRAPVMVCDPAAHQPDSPVFSPHQMHAHHFHQYLDAKEKDQESTLEVSDTARKRKSEQYSGVWNLVEWCGLDCVRGPLGFVRRAIDMLDSSAGWMLAYFFLNLSITIYNKVILQMFKFKYPWLLTALHAFCSVIGAYLTVYVFKIVDINISHNKPGAPSDLKLPFSVDQTRDGATSSEASKQNVFDAQRRRAESVQDLFVMLAFSVLYTVNIATSNVSLNLVSLPFHQIVRSTNPAVTVVLEKLIFGKRHSNLTYCSLAMVIVGVGMATLGEYDFSALGFLLTCLGVLLSALKGVATNVLLVGRLRLHPMDLLMRMSSLACMQCLFIAYVSGEYDRMLSNVSRLRRADWSWFTLRTKPNGESRGGGHAASVGWLTIDGLLLALLTNGVLAFLLNYVSFTANKKTSALSMTVAGNVKQALGILLSMWVFGYVVDVLNGLGILITLCGGVWYSSIELATKMSKRFG